MGENITGLSVMEASAKSVQAVRNLMKGISIPNPQQVGVKEGDIPHLAKIALANSDTEGNPRKLTQGDFVNIFECAIKGELV